MATQHVKFTDLTDAEKSEYAEHMNVMKRSLAGYLVFSFIKPQEVLREYKSLARKSPNRAIRAASINFFKSHRVTF